MSKVLYEKRGEVAYITLNRPEVKNAIDLDVHHRLREIWTDFRDDDNIRVAILTGTGDAFCAVFVEKVLHQLQMLAELVGGAAREHRSTVFVALS